MSDLIYREDAKDFVRHARANGLDVIEYLDEVPTVDAVPVRHGRWNNGYEVQNCSECGYRGKRSYHYCPKCGARMDGGVNDVKTD